jgi:hypothetical protein
MFHVKHSYENLHSTTGAAAMRAEVAETMASRRAEHA